VHHPRCDKKIVEGRAGQKGQKDRRGRGPYMYREYSAFSPNREAGAECRQNGQNGENCRTPQFCREP